MSTDTLDDWYSFADLKKHGIVPNWPTLRAWQNNPKINFPKGRLFGPNTRRWSKQKEIDPWLATRPVVREEFDLPKRKSGKRIKEEETAAEI
jgi:hypothetical protein